MHLFQEIHFNSCLAGVGLLLFKIGNMFAYRYLTVQYYPFSPLQFLPRGVESHRSPLGREHLFPYLEVSFQHLVYLELCQKFSWCKSEWKVDWGLGVGGRILGVIGYIGGHYQCCCSTWSTPCSTPPFFPCLVFSPPHLPPVLPPCWYAIAGGLRELEAATLLLQMACHYLQNCKGPMLPEQ